MMTVKQVTSSGDSLFEALEVTYHEDRETVPRQVMYLRPSDKSWHCLTEGSIYVMNDHGKTVSSYGLNESSKDAVGQKQGRVF